MFGLQVLLNPMIYKHHVQLIANMIDKCQKAKGTAFHSFLNAMAEKDVLKIHLTLNIDTLTLQYPLLNGITRKLHGCISMVKCMAGHLGLTLPEDKPCLDKALLLPAGNARRIMQPEHHLEKEPIAFPR